MEDKIDALKMVREIRDDFSEKIYNKSYEEVKKFFDDKTKKVQPQNESAIK